MNLNQFAKLINDKCGLVVSCNQNEILARAIKSGMHHNGIESPEKYYDLLLSNQDETFHLINLVTINETHFFRERTHYDLFANRLFPDLLKQKQDKGEKVKLLSAGCSSGEEPYSLVMSLLEKYGREVLNSIAILGCDINQKILDKARQGIYGYHSFRGCTESLREKYFLPVQNGQQYEICDDIKRVVEFHRINLLNDSYPAQLHDIDVIFYRNVSIYFKPDVQARIFTKLSGILSNEGYIFTSSAETFHHDVGILFLTELEGIFLYRKKVELGVDDRRKYSKSSLIPSNIKSVTLPSPSKIKPEPKDTVQTPKQKKDLPRKEQRKQTPNQELFDKALYAAMDKKYANALDFIDTLIKNSPALVKAYNLKSSILINLERFEEARNVCREVLILDEWDLECHILLGIIAKIACNHDEALHHFRTAIYAQPACWLAHFYLAEIQNSKGVAEEARREYGIAVKLLETKGVEDKGVTYFPISYSVDQLTHLCKHNIAELCDIEN